MEQRSKIFFLNYIQLDTKWIMDIDGNIIVYIVPLITLTGRKFVVKAIQNVALRLIIHTALCIL